MHLIRYAPAYERFGSQISAIHFIGPNKPWVSITYRPPGIKYSQVSDKSQNIQSQSYDYESLVDRWFDVYDRHYRSDCNLEHVNFDFTRYDSLWDVGTSYGADIMRPASAPPSGAVLGLDDLRKIAVEGISGYTSAIQARPKVGEYRSLPLEGRVDLMRPRKVSPLPTHEEKGEAIDDQGGDQNATPKQAFIVLEGGELPRMETLSTPLPHEVPPAPYNPPLDLSPSMPPTPYQHDTHQQRPQTGSYSPPTSEAGTMSLQLGMSWTERRFSAQNVSHYQESEQSDDQTLATVSRQLPWKVSTRPVSPLAERHHRKDANHVRHGHLSPRGGGYHSPRGAQSPRGVQSPRGHHSPTHTRHSPPPAVRRHSEHSHYPPPYQHIPHQHSLSYQHHQHQHHQRLPMPLSQGQRQQAQVPPSSPPKLEWNPAIEPPPKTPPPPSGFPSDTYFPNIWDQAPDAAHDTSYQSFPSHIPGPKSETFFQPPPPSEIPTQLLREGQYEQVIGRASGEQEGNLVTAPVPDRKKVHAVFPWEEKPRHAPRRVFPASESPPPVANFIDEAVPASRSATKHSPSMSQVLSPPLPITHPFNLAYSNAWDAVPSIQKYASRLVSPRHSVYQLPPPEHDDSWRKWDEEREREYQDKQDASSMDGDDEDEGDEDEDNPGQPVRHDSDSGRERPQPRRSRTGSNASLTSGKSKKYRGRGVQTIPIETRSMGVQVNTSAEDAEAPRKGKHSKPGRGTGSGARHSHAGTFLLPAVTFKVDPDQMAVGSPMTQPPQASAFPFPTKISPAGVRSPQMLGSPRTYSPPSMASPQTVPSPPRAASPKPLSPPKVPSPRGSSSPRAIMSPRCLSAGQVPTSKLALSPQTSSSPAVGPSADSSPRLSPKLTRLTSPPLQRMSSNDTTLTTSTSTSGQVETPEGTPILGPQAPPQRKGGRVWDPARGVDVFKRSSEEVLARFLRSGSFDEEDGQRRHV